MTVEELGAKVRAFREARRLSREDLARLSGVAAVTLERLEGRNPPKPKRPTLIDLARALEWDVDETLAALGHEPLSDLERTELGRRSRESPVDELQALLPHLSPEQVWVLVHAASVMLRPDVPWQQNPGPDRPRWTVVSDSEESGDRSEECRDRGSC